MERLTKRDNFFCGVEERGFLPQIKGMVSLQPMQN